MNLVFEKIQSLARHKPFRQRYLGFVDFLVDPLQFMQVLANKGQALARVRLGPHSFVFVFSPEAIQEILVKRAKIYVQNPKIFGRIQPVTGKRGLVQLQGEDSQKARTRARPIFGDLDAAQKITEQFTEEMLCCLGNEGTMDVTEEMTKLILRTALKIFLNIDSPELVQTIGKKFLRLNYLCGIRMRSLAPLPLKVPTLKNREIGSLRFEIRSLIEKHIAKNRTPSRCDVPNLFQDDQALLDHCMTFLFAGHETTAASLSFTLLLLAQNPQYQQAIAQGDTEITLAVYKESLRLFPPAYMLAREASVADCLLGKKIRKKDQVLLAIAAIHRNPNIFKDPHLFRPERFFKNANYGFAFLPFGAGPKSCIGERLAYLEAGVVLRLVCQKIQFFTDVTEIKFEPLITLHPVCSQTIQFKKRKVVSHACR